MKRAAWRSFGEKPYDPSSYPTGLRHRRYSLPDLRGGDFMSPLIVRQMQPCPVSCVSTCLAMLAGRPAAEVIEEMHKPYREGDLTLRDMLNFLGIEYTAFFSVDNPPLADEGAYLCTAPSLNIEAGNHQILIEVTDEAYFVLDPVQGREDRKYYVPRGQSSGDPLAIELGGFVVDAFISRSHLAEKIAGTESVGVAA